MESRRVSRQRPRPLRGMPLAAQPARRHQVAASASPAGLDPEGGDGWVPNITQHGLSAWTLEDIVKLLATGENRDADTVGGEMGEVVRNLKQLGEKDIAAIAAYIKSLPPVEGPRRTVLRSRCRSLTIHPADGSMNFFKAISLKLISALLFALMSALVRYLGETGVPVGQIGVFPQRLRDHPGGADLCVAARADVGGCSHRARSAISAAALISVAGMFLNFAALARLPLVDATAISFAVAADHGGVRGDLPRRSACASIAGRRSVVGFIGVIVMLWPHLDVAQFSAEGAAAQAAMLGAVFALIGAFFNAGAVIQTRRLTDTETTSSIVFYFSLICALAGLATLPFGWLWPTGWQLAALIGAGLVGGTRAHLS